MGFRVFIHAIAVAVLSAACSSERAEPVGEPDTDGDGLSDLLETSRGSDPRNPCDPPQPAGYTGYDANSTFWSAADCDVDGLSNGAELEGGSNPYQNEALDSDGDGIPDLEEAAAGSDPEDPCSPAHEPGYVGFDPENPAWAAADCDADGFSNGEEWEDGTNPYEVETLDTDGDGITDRDETVGGTDPSNPCDPVQTSGYEGFDPGNPAWGAADCDADGLSNAAELTDGLDPYTDERVFASTEWQPLLSQMGIFKAPLSDLALERTAYAYALTTPLFTDYSRKLRTISLPKDGQMALMGDGLLEFPEGTVITKTFFYFQDERNPGLGKRIIETRVLLLKNGVWEVGNYLWDENQADAVLDPNRHVLNVEWTDLQGQVRSAGYVVPNTNNCIMCHSNYGSNRPIGPKARALRPEEGGGNLLQAWIDAGVLTENVPLSAITPLPDWSDPALGLEPRARAYMDMNCAHCHQPGSNNYFGMLDLRYETSLSASQIEFYAFAITDRIQSPISSIKMPLIGTSIPHEEGIDLINAYIDTLQ